VSIPDPPYQEQVDGQNDYRTRFGSAHANGCHFLLCDGSVHLISYTVDNQIHGRLCSRCDGMAIPPKIVEP
jgi:prepilin-type processing-associated H-X9-DG protein